MEADADGQPRVVTRRAGIVEPVAMDHQVADAGEDVEYLDRDRLGVGAEVDEPLLGMVGVEERGDRDADLGAATGSRRPRPCRA